MIGLLDRNYGPWPATWTLMKQLKNEQHAQENLIFASNEAHKISSNLTKLGEEKSIVSVRVIH